MGRGRQPVQMRGGVMVWGKVDDRLHAHPKVETAGVHAMGLWVLALSHSCAVLTDGHVSRTRAAALAGPNAPELAERLCAAGLWHGADEPCDDPDCDANRKPLDGWRFHAWADYQPTRESVEASRKRKSDAGREGGYRKAASRKLAGASVLPEEAAQQNAGTLPRKSSAPVPVPIPSRPGGGGETPDPDDVPPAPPPVPAAEWLSPTEQAIADALTRSECLRGLATLALVPRLAQHTNGDGNTGRLRVADVLHAIRSADEKEALRVAAGELPRDNGALAGMLVAFVKSTRVGEADEAPRVPPRPGAPPPGVRTVDTLRTTNGVDIMAEMARRASMQAGQVPR